MLGVCLLQATSLKSRKGGDGGYKGLEGCKSSGCLKQQIKLKVVDAGGSKVRKSVNSKQRNPVMVAVRVATGAERASVVQACTQCVGFCAMCIVCVMQ